MNDYYEKYKKEIFSITALVFCLLIIYAIWIGIGRIGKVGVEFHLVPYSAAVTINGTQYGDGTQYIPTGTYAAKITHEGFKPTDVTLIVAANKTKNIMAVSLTPESDAAKKWAESHRDDYARNEPYGAEQARADGQYMRDKDPIINKLPYEHPYYKIAYKREADRSITVTILTESPRYRLAAVNKIRELGFDPTDLTIEFTDFKNPLEQAR